MTNQPQEKPEWFEHIADDSNEKSNPVNRVKKNRVAPVLGIIAIALAATTYGLSKSPSDAKAPTAIQVSANLNSQNQIAPTTIDPKQPNASAPNSMQSESTNPNSPLPTASNPATLPKIPTPVVPNGAKSGDENGEDHHKRPGHGGDHKSGRDDNEGDD